MAWQSFELHGRRETQTGEGSFAPQPVYALDGMDSSDPLVPVSALVCAT